MVAITSNGIVKYEMRFVFNRSQGANHPLRGDTESCEPFELEFFIDQLIKSGQSDVLKKFNDEIFQKIQSAIMVAPGQFVSGIFAPSLAPAVPADKNLSQKRDYPFK